MNSKIQSSIDIFKDAPFNEIYYSVPTAWGGTCGSEIPRPTPSDFISDYFKNLNFSTETTYEQKFLEDYFMEINLI